MAREEQEQGTQESSSKRESMERSEASSGRASESVSNLTMVRVGGSLLVVSRDQLAGLLQGAGG